MGNAESIFPNPISLKRDGEPLDGPDPQRVKTGEATDGAMEDQAFSAQHTIGLQGAELVVTVAGVHRRRAGQEPNRGWPAYEITFLMGNPTDVIREPVLVSKNYRRIGPKHGRATGAPLEPLATALNLAGAHRVDATEFRTLDGNFALGRPLVNRISRYRNSPDAKHEWGKPATNGEWV